jgi:hypothetical protein
MLLRTAHRCTTTHFGGHGDKEAHGGNLPQILLKGKSYSLPTQDEPDGRV